ncbi:hypothetical protein HYV43_02485 [Candidatus Micrarchaeota archaeon]|nr:hypothetical protein [Candidatus Micrarchaeota archaeon]
MAWLDEYLESTEKSLAQMDLSTISPTSWRHTQPLFAQAWLNWFSKIVDTVKEKNIPYATIAQFFPPDLCREHLFFTLEDVKVAKWPQEKRLEYADFFYQLLNAQMEPGDLFGIQGSTRPKLDLAAIRAKTFQTGTPDSARALGRLYNAAYNLSTALYLDYYMGNGIENYGPYPLGGGRILVVKEMRHLFPTLLWPRFQAAADHVKLYCIYQDVSFSTTLIACHGNYVGDPIFGLKAWRLEKDGKAVEDLDEIRNLTQNLAENGSRQWKELLALSEEKLIRKSIEIRCFIFKPLCDALGLDWRPTSKLLNAAKGKTLQDGWNTWRHPKTEKAQKAYWRKIWDPRIDVYPDPTEKQRTASPGLKAEA